MENIYRDIAARTEGNIYIGVVGPVRTGKSTFIKRIMEELVIPNIQDPYRKERARDELPQSGSGKTIMTSEPKFIPEEAVEIFPEGTAKMRIRMIDSVGYMVEGAVGAEEDGEPRMVTTPWYDYEIPMTEAAELGTQKVMQEHCSIGIVVTTDGSITDIPRQDYLDAERRAISHMQATGKPFLVIINSTNPDSEAVAGIQRQISEQFGITPVAADCQALTGEDIQNILKNLLYAFPMYQLHIHLPRWMDALESTHPVKAELYQALVEKTQQIGTLAQAEGILQSLTQLPNVLDFNLRKIDLATGTVSCAFGFPEELFYEILSNRTGMTIENQGQLLQLLTELSAMKREYDKFADALSSVNATGYGIVMPRSEEMKLEKPEVIRKNGSYGVRLKASAPSIHMMRVDIDTQINPMVGDEKQSQDLIDYLMGEDPDKLWQSNIFGKSVYALIQDGLTSKLMRTPEDVRSRFRSTLSRVVNEGASGLICLIL
ncbi:MAG: stage IV sporulation protein A [Oscillospiraceae bacterium]|nr:stage IV sporulation protein A [Oscillospiraceae bacterium]